MARLIKHIGEKHLVEFDNGAFDEWCVFLTRSGSKRYAPKDTEYFSILKKLSLQYGAAKIYNDFLRFYHLTTTVIDPAAIDLITNISHDYDQHVEEMDIWFTVIYAGMIAEENKANAILKKRIKRLGMHQILLNNVDPVAAAEFSKGKNWKDLDKLMKEKGF